MKQQYDIVIVGAGLSAMAFAAAVQSLVKQKGCRIALLDPREQPSHFDAGVIALSLSSLRILNHYVTAGIACVGEAIDAVDIAQAGRAGQMTVTAASCQLKHLGLVVERSELRQFFMGSCSEMDRYQQVSIHAVSNQQSGYQIETDQGIIQSSLFIVADGYPSELMPWLGLRYRTEAHDQAAFLGCMTTDTERQHVALELLTECGTIAVLPMRQAHRQAIVWIDSVESIAHFYHQSALDRQRSLQALFGNRLGQLSSVSQGVQMPLCTVVSVEAARPGWISLGDAAQRLHPIGGQGFNLVLRDIARLVAALGTAESVSSRQLAPDFLEACRPDREQTRFMTEQLASGIGLGGRQLFWSVHNLPQAIKTEVLRHLLGLSVNVPFYVAR